MEINLYCYTDYLKDVLVASSYRRSDKEKMRQPVDVAHLPSRGGVTVCRSTHLLINAVVYVDSASVGVTVHCARVTIRSN